MSLETKVTPNYSENVNPHLYERSVRRTRAVVDKLWGLNILGQENFPMTGPAAAVFVHRSYLDPWLLGMTVPRSIHGMAKNQLLNWYYFGLGRIYLANRGIFFIDRDNFSRESLDKSVDVLKQGEVLGVAPEGTHKNKGRQLGPTKHGVGRIAARAASESGQPVALVPIAMTTEHINRPRGLRQPIWSLVGEPVVVHGAETIAQRKAIATETDERMRDELQNYFDMALDLAAGQKSLADIELSHAQS